MANEYRREIDALWEDMHNSYDELEKGMPKSFKRGMKMIEKSLDLSMENVRMLSYTEPIENLNKIEPEIVPKKQITPLKPEKSNNEDCFKWLRSN